MKHTLLFTVAAVALMSGTAFAKGATSETARLAEQANASATGDATIATTTTRVAVPAAAVVVPASPAYIAPAAGGALVTAPIGASLAANITDPDTSEFRQALANAPLPANFDPSKGYTIFAVVNDAFDANDDPRSYVLNDVVTVNSMAGASDRFHTVAGDSIRFNRMGSSYYVDDMRVNDVTSAPNGVIYKIGGHTAATLDTGVKAGM